MAMLRSVSFSVVSTVVVACSNAGTSSLDGSTAGSSNSGGAGAAGSQGSGGHGATTDPSRASGGSLSGAGSTGGSPSAESGGAQNTSAGALAGGSTGGGARPGGLQGGMAGTGAGGANAAGAHSEASSGQSGSASSGQSGSASSGSGGAGGSVGSNSAPPTEKVLPRLAAARQEHSVVAAAGEIYVVGGYAPSVTDSVLAYNPGQNSWREVAAFPERMNHGNAGAIADKIYVAGYYINGGMSIATTKVYMYDPQVDEWTAKSPLPEGTQRAGGCVAVDSGFMYVFGGAHSGKSVNNAARYDPAADQWEELPALPERREHCAAGALGGILYVAGGRADGITGVQEKTWAYDPLARAWTAKAALSPARGGLAGAVLGERFFVFGGEGNPDVASGVFPDIDAYDPSTNAWQKLPPMNVPRHGFGAATLDGRIYLAGGAIRQGGGASDQSSVFYFP